MKIITINISEPHVKALQVLQDLGLYPSRSEAIRVALRDFLQREMGLANLNDLHPLSKDDGPIQPAVDVANKKREIARLLRKLRENQPELRTVNP